MPQQAAVKLHNRVDLHNKRHNGKIDLIFAAVSDDARRIYLKHRSLLASGKRRPVHHEDNSGMFPTKRSAESKSLFIESVSDRSPQWRSW